MQIVGILIRVLEMPRFSHQTHPPVPYVSQLQIPTLSPGRIGFDAHSTTLHRRCLSSTRVCGIENLRSEFGHGPTVKSLYNKPLKITMLAVLKLSHVETYYVCVRSFVLIHQLNHLLGSFIGQFSKLT